MKKPFNPKTHRRNGEVVREVTGNLVAAKQTRVGAAVDGILRSKEELRAALKAFLGGKRCLPFRPEWLWQEFSQLKGSNTCLVLPFAPAGSPELFLPD